MAKKVTTSRIGWRALVQKYDPNYRTYQPVTYFFSGGRTKKDPRVPAHAR